MRVIVVGLGVQGYKRRNYAGADFVASVDPVNPEADYRELSEIPLADYDAVLACVPDDPKFGIVRYCLLHGKHVLVEKPLWTEHNWQIEELQVLARQNKVVCYIAYNHRFEPHFVRMRDLIASGELGNLYSCRMFYGNGTARLVRASVWRDRGDGVMSDLGSHLLDLCRFWFGAKHGDFKLTSAHTFENKALDHVVICSEDRQPRLELEMTLCMWRNYFSCDLLAENGSAHIESLCKWGPTKFTRRLRILPSGLPTEQQVTLVESDPTWSKEYAYFKALIAGGQITDLSNDLWLQSNLRRLGTSTV